MESLAKVSPDLSVTSGFLSANADATLLTSLPLRREFLATATMKALLGFMQEVLWTNLRQVATRLNRLLSLKLFAIVPERGKLSVKLHLSKDG